MRKFWTDHVVWTRDYIIAAAADSGDQEAAANRLMKNQEHIGNAMAIYDGCDAGNKLTSFLKEHIQIAVELTAAAKASDQDKMTNADRRWPTC